MVESSLRQCVGSGHVFAGCFAYRNIWRKCLYRAGQTLHVEQVWDLNKPAPEEVGRDYHLVLASNVLHTAANMSSAPTLAKHPQMHPYASLKVCLSGSAPPSPATVQQRPHTCLPAT